MLRRVHACCEADQSLGVRVYRTHRGWRLILAGRDISPVGSRMRALFRQLHADPVYESLCIRQHCWRARLSPKPFRVGMAHYPHPQNSEKAHSPEVLDWLRRYEAACEGKAVCRLLDVVGRDISSPLVEMHDQRTRAGIPDCPLA